MVLDAGQVRTSVGVLATTAVFATVLALVASAPLGRDTRRLESTVSQLKAGDRTVRTGVHRADELGQVARALDELTERLDALERERATFEHERRAMLTQRRPRPAHAAQRAAGGDRGARRRRRPRPAALPAGDGPRRRGARLARRRPVPARQHRVGTARAQPPNRSTCPSSPTRPSRRWPRPPRPQRRRCACGRPAGVTVQRQPDGDRPGDPQPRRQRHPPRAGGLERGDRRRPARRRPSGSSTRARGSRPSSPTTPSTASPAPTRAGTARRAVPGSAWPSPGAWSRPTVAASGSSSRRAGGWPSSCPPPDGMGQMPDCPSDRPGAPSTA